MHCDNHPVYIQVLTQVPITGRKSSTFNTLARTVISLLLIPPSFGFSALSPDQHTISWTGKEMNSPARQCGPKQQSAIVFQSRQVSAQSNADDLSTAQAGEQLELFQNLQIGTCQSNGRDLRNSLHDPANLLEAGSSLSDPLQPEGHSAYISHTNEIGQQSENSASVTAVRPSSDGRNSGIELALPPLEWILAPAHEKQSALDHVLAGLIRCEAYARKDGDISFAEDCRQAWISLHKTFVKKEFLNYREAEAVVCTMMFGCPQQDLPQRTEANRRAKLGPEYHDWFSSDGSLRPDVPKLKPVTSSAEGFTAAKAVSHPTSSVEYSADSSSASPTTQRAPSLAEAGEEATPILRPSPALPIQDKESIA